MLILAATSAIFSLLPTKIASAILSAEDTAKKIFEEYKIKRTPAQWAFRWLWNQPEVTVVLSGMNSDEMVRDNIQTASTVEVGELGEDEEQMLKEVVKAINAKMKVGCTGCGYCMPCPKGVDIPGTFAAYNRRYAEGRFWSFVEMSCVLHFERILLVHPTASSVVNVKNIVHSISRFVKIWMMQKKNWKHHCTVWCRRQ